MQNSEGNVNLPRENLIKSGGGGVITIEEHFTQGEEVILIFASCHGNCMG